MIHVAVIGTGYVGLVTGVCFSDFGHRVTCFDINPDKISRLQSGKSPIYEPGLDTLLSKNIEQGRLFFSDQSRSLKEADVIFIGVGTPSLTSGAVDMSQVHSAWNMVADLMRTDSRFRVIVHKSTVPVGSAAAAYRFFIEAGITPAQFGVISNPEFLREGSAIQDTFSPDRIVLGGNCETSLALMKKLYHPLASKQVPIYTSTWETAELIKYAANAFLATKLSFINEMANLCDHVGADVTLLSKAIGEDPRIGRLFLNPGPGYGGSCFPKDTQALMNIAKSYGMEMDIVSAAERINLSQKTIVLHKIKAHFGDDLSGKRIGVLGLAFKPDTDDVRESASLPVIRALLDDQVTIQAFDPIAMPNAQGLLGDSIQFCTDIQHTFQDADAVVLMTDWNEFKDLDLGDLLPKMKTPVLFDVRNLYDPELLFEMGFTYYGLGRQRARPT